MGQKAKLIACTGLAAIAAAIACEPAIAQPAANAATSADDATPETDEIIVTARKREETSMAVPVVVTAVSGAQMERRAIVRLDDVAKLVPQLQIGKHAAPQGGNIGIRGIAGSETNPFADQAVSFNVDGVQVSRALIRRMAEMDLGQIEVLKGPQALFFGKNSPAGVISIRSADPTDRFEAKASAGYEFHAREWRGDGFVSGPLTDTLGARLAVFGTTMRGWFDNDLAVDNIYTVGNPKHAPKAKEFAIRGTLKWEPSDRFDARLKVTYNKLKDNGILNTVESFNCVGSAPQLGGGLDNCKLDGQGQRLYFGPFLHTLSRQTTVAQDFPADGKPFLRQRQALFSYEMNYDVTDALTLTSVTGYYYLRVNAAENYNYVLDPKVALVSTNAFGNNEFSEELRLRSSFDGPANFLLGGFYQSTKAFTGSYTLIGLEPVNGVNPVQLNDYLLKQRGTAYSVFGQVSVNPIEQIEVTGGLRWSYERKRLPFIATQVGPAAPGPLPRPEIAPIPGIAREDSWNNLSPEFTVTYRPSDRLTLFGSYREGFLSGGFNSGTSVFTGDLRFDQQIIRGFEGGVKALLFDRTLRLNLAAYHYRITGLQIANSIVTSTGVIQQVLNAGKVTVKGIEGDFNYRTPLQGLTLHGGVGYNDAKYNVFNINCYTGQLQEEGCNFGPPTATAVINGVTYLTYGQQNLAGQPLLRAPKWSGTVGASFERDIGSNLRFAIDGDMSFSSSYFMNTSNSPRSIQPSYQLFDASVRVGAQDDSWELALIGRNLTDKYYGMRSGDRNLVGFGQGRAANDPRGRLLADQVTAVHRGREVMLRLTVRYGGR